VDAQASRDERLKIADVVIDTDGSLGHTMSQADALWARIAAERSARRANG
jgi:dephospho-CoA kinase